MSLPASGVAITVEIAFVANPYAASLAWTDVTDRVIQFTTKAGRNYETDHNESSTVDMVLRNNDGALNPLNPASPYAPYVLPFRPIRITATAGGTAHPVWYGYVQSWPQTVNDVQTGYEIVEITAVDAAKAILGFIPGDPYDTKIEKDFNVSASAPSWEFYAFDETAAPFACENTAAAGSFALGAASTPVTKVSPSPCRTGVTFDGGGVLDASGTGSTAFQGELWMRPHTLPTSPATSQAIAASGGVNNGAFKMMCLSGLSGHEIVEVAENNGDYGNYTGLFLISQYPNLMPSDNAADFTTSVADWASEAPSHVTISRSTVNPQHGTANMRIVSDATGGNVALQTRVPVTAGQSYHLSMAFDDNGYGVANMQVSIRWYDASGTLLSTVSHPLNGATSGVYSRYGSAAVATAPTGAASMALLLRFGAHAATYDIDAVQVVQAGAEANGVLIAYTAPSAGAPLYLVAQLAASSTTLDVFITTAVPSVGYWHLLSWAGKAATGTASLFCVDGVSQPQTTATSPSIAPDSAKPLSQLGGLACFDTGTSTYSVGAGFIGDLAAFYQTAAATGIVNVDAFYAQQHYTYGTTSTGGARTHDFPAELTSARVADVLTAIGFPSGMTSLETGLTGMSASGDVAGSTAVTLLEQAADTELGNVFVGPDGMVTFHNRDHRNNPVTVATFGEDTAAGEIPYEVDIRFDFDDTYIFNSVQITQANASPAFSYVAEDAPSQNSYGMRTLQRTVECASQSDVGGMADTLLAWYKDPRPRLVTLSVECRSKPWTFPAVLGLGIGDCVRVNRRPAYGAPAFGVDVFIDGIAHTVDADTWHTTFSTTPVYPNTTY